MIRFPGSWSSFWLLSALFLIPPPGCQRRVEAHEGKLHIVVIGDRYTDAELPRFDVDAAKIQSTILAAEPFKSVADKIIFLPIRSTEPLGCAYSQTITRLLTCPVSKVTVAVNAIGLEYDHIIVVVNSSQYGGSGGSISVTYNGDQMGGVVLHEWGHTFGGLLDEYTAVSTTGNVANVLVANCYAAPPPTGIPGSWALGCKHPNWARQKAVRANGWKVNSVMYSLAYKLYNAVSVERIRARLAQYTEG